MNTNISNKVFLVLILLFSVIPITACKETENVTSIKIEINTGSRSIEKAEITSKISEFFGLLPKTSQEKLASEGWELVYTDKEIEDIYNLTDETLKDITGITDAKEKTIYIEEGSLDRCLHEFVHAILYDQNKGKSTYIKYQGIEDEMLLRGFDEYYTKNYDEYIVENIARYLEDASCLDKYPLTKLTVEEMLQELNP